MKKSNPITDEQKTFRKNLEVIAKRDPNLAERLLKDNDEGNFKCEISLCKNNAENLTVDDGEKQIHLHSRYDPQKEAKQLVDGAFETQRNYYILYGLGLGYVLEELVKRTIESDLIFFMEPEIAIFREALKHRDLGKILSSPRIFWSVGDSPEAAFAKWAKLYNIARLDGLGVIELPPVSKISQPDYLKRFNNKLKALLVTAGGNLQTLMIMAKQYQANTMHNVRYVMTNPPVMDLFDKFTGKPAIIVSAGPSLDKNIDLLHEARDKALIIAVDTSLKPLIAKGIEPHLICTGDPQEANYRHLKNASTCDSYLIAEPMTNPKSFRDFDNRLFVATYGDKVVSWIERFIPKLGFVMCWGSVATMAFDVARKLGADPIIFIGQDLSFPDGRTYAHGTYFETEDKRPMTVESQEKHGVYKVEDIFGNEITTNRQMFAYHRWFVTEISRTKAKVINASEGGILKEGVEILSLRETLDKYCTDSFDPMSVIKQVASNFTGFDVKSLRKALSEMVKDLRDCRDISFRSFESSRDWLKASVNFTVLPQDIAVENLNELEEARKELIRRQDAFKIIEMADQVAIKRFLKGYRIVNGKKMGLASYREVLEIYIKFYASLVQTLNVIIPHFESARNWVKDFEEGKASTLFKKINYL
jgi:hypothetical protein